VKLIKRTIAVVVALSVIIGCLYGISSAADKYDIYPIAENHSLNGKIIFLDAGHGKGNLNGAGTYLEHEGNLTIALLVKQNLENCGATVIMTRPDETDVDSYERMALVNKTALQEIRKEYVKNLENTSLETQKAKLQENINEIDELIAVMQTVIDDPELSPKYFNSPWAINTRISSELKRIFEYEACQTIQENMLLLSIHANAATGSGYTSVKGTVTYYLNNTFSDNLKYYTDYAFVDQSIAFSQLIQDNVVNAGNFKDRGLAVNNFFMLRECNMPACLLEVAFFTNSSDRAKLQNESYQKRIATGITYAIQEYFEIYGGIDYLMGDINDDGIISNADVIAIARFLVDLIPEPDLMIADFDNDGAVTNSDLLELARIIVNS